VASGRVKEGEGPVRKTVVFTLVLLFSAIWLQARASAQTDSNTSTIKGCLAFTDGRYKLTDNTGKVYQLSNEANKLQKQVGHWIEVTGKPGTRTRDTSQQGVESSVKEESVFRVKTVKWVADSCSGQ
jgi:hypothetical protein